jgi:predicted PurR-regulated permease PerM
MAKMTALKTHNFFFIVLLLLVSVAFFSLIQPYYAAIIWAVILALILSVTGEINRLVAGA